MKGDFSRLRFNPSKLYTAVLEQQGRVALDADANEQCAIDEYLRSTETIDVVGEFGTPIHDAGFEIAVWADSRILISSGRFYIEGLLCENEATRLYDNQPFLIQPSPTDVALFDELRASRGGLVLWVYLEAWQRLVTALDDECLREPALGQADTTARLQTVWRVMAEIQKPVATDCCAEMYSQIVSDGAATGLMYAATGGGTDDCSCQPIPAAGYQGLENQLYRVEIHDASANALTCKWSRENGSVVAAVTDVVGQTVSVDSLGPDANLGFQVGQWVEISDDSYLFGQVPRPGNLYQIQSIDSIGRSMTMSTTVAPVDTTTGRVRRWDQAGSAASSAGVPITAGVPIQLENGIQVTFKAGDFKAGDYWTIPARTASGQIDWPPCGSNNNEFQPAQRARVFRAPLACVHWIGSAEEPPPTQGQPLNNETARVLSPSGGTLSGGIVKSGTLSEGALNGGTLNSEPLSGVALNTDILHSTIFQAQDCRRKFYPLTELSPPVVPNALHVTGFSWQNDDVMTFDQFVANGLSITFDQAPLSPINGANWIVTLEPIAVLGSDYINEQFANEQFTNEQFTDLRVGNPSGLSVQVPPPPAVIPRSIVIVDSNVATYAGGDTISWQFSVPTNQSVLEALNRMLAAGAATGQFGRARVRLVGRTISSGSGTAQRFLDGQPFGKAAVRADGTTPRIDLQMPSGNGEKASDFEGWFYVAPVVQLVSVTIDYPEVTAVSDAGRVELVADVNGERIPVFPRATVTVNYPVVANTEVRLTQPPPTTSKVAVARIPTTVTIGRGQTTASFGIALERAVFDGSSAAFEITASLDSPIEPSTQSAPFTVALTKGVETR